ncbi:DNA ligase [Vibrio breoganii]|uniref:DNA ligase n=2 Tax=Vibrio breoganii TaxID=553239 RepID=A0AAN1CRT2_9VIBR|nr:DNA ligase [Vibrio breoganii]ANO32855.1 DNA ligase [Vibrio breoganii]PMG80142.1 DNA ligase [Vibrio breoganii]PMK50751.1 DNA ligase [Vibrio breoganii]PMO31370.1 DNA ligase [Vibrio breoganii]
MSIRTPVTLIALACSALESETAQCSEFSDFLMLAKPYQGEELNSNYLVSEKLDGIRAIWDGKELRTRGGIALTAPSSFTEQLPTFAVEGELWAGRGNYAQVQKTVLDERPDEPSWSTITYMIFDRLDSLATFEERYASLRLWKMASGSRSDQVQVVEQIPFQSNAQLNKQLQQVTKRGGEGLVVRHKQAVYMSGRSEQLFKIKIHQDAEATVIGYKPGNGKYQSLVGALHVESPSGVQFYIGSGLTDEMRKAPPMLGSEITYRYNGTTENGVPRFARFLRERKVH